MTIDAHVDLFINGVWVDISADVRNISDLTINRGSANWSSTGVEEGRCELLLTNTTGTYNNRNPSSVYYGKLVPNTPVRIRIGADVRAVMEVADWSPLADLSGRNAWIPLQAAGILRRLKQGQKDAVSPLRKTLSAYPSDILIGYWALEDGGDATQLAAGVGRPLATAGNLALASASDLPGSDPLPTPTAGSLMFGYVPSFTASVPTYDAQTDGWSIAWVMKIPSAPGSDTELLHWWGLGDVSQWRVVLTAAGNIVLKGYSAAGTELFADAGIPFNSSPITNPYGQWLVWQMSVFHSPPTLFGSVSWERLTPGVVGAIDNVSGSLVSATGVAGQPWATEHHGFGASIGHLSVLTDAFTLPVLAAFGWPGERAPARMSRLCTDAGVTLTIVGSAALGERMGPQSRDTLVNVLQECVNADRGILYETRDSLGLTYRTRASLYDQASGLDLDYTARQVDGQLQPADDAQAFWNDVTVTRPSGSSAHSVQLTGPTSTQASPNGIGTYDRGALTANLFTDDQLQPLADWILHEGTWDERRFPSIAVKLHAPAWTSNATKTAQAAALDIGDIATLTNLPAYFRGVDALNLLMTRGCQERINKTGRTLTWFTSPGWPWEVWQLDTGGSTLTLAASAGATSLKEATSSGPGWSTTVPYHQIIDGEALTVTAMSTDTPTFVNAGTVATGNNASVVPGLPASLADGDAMYLWAAIRSSGTGTVNTPAGWTPLVTFGNCSLFGRYRVTGDTAPTVSFTGGAAGDDTSARIFAFRGASLEQDGTAATLLNGSVQDIATPFKAVRRDACVVLYLGWKQDDWTSVATIAGATEVADNPTTTGNDQGICADYLIETTATDVAATSFVVTGGAVAISRSVVVAMRPLQTATVTRAVNGVSKSLATGKAVAGWRMGVLAL